MNKIGLARLSALHLILPLFVVFSVKPALADGDHTISGFVDAQFHINDEADDSQYFNVFDGAFYLSHAVGGGKVYVDIPFSVALTGTQSATQTFAIAATKPQAYVWYGYDMGLYWTLGQFDSMYGFEANDSIDNFHSRQGRLNNRITPTVHTGLLAGYNFTDEIELRLLISNRNFGTKNAQNLEYGAMLSYNGMFSAAVGYLHHKAVDANDSDMLINVMLGFKMANLSVDVEFDAIKTPGSGTTDTGIAIGGYISYAFNDKYSFGIRPEYLSKDPGGNHSEFQITAGPSIKLSDALTTRLDYTFNTSKAVDGGTSVKEHTGILSVAMRI